MVKQLIKNINNYLSLVKFSHTIFALPFAIIGFSLGIKESNYHFDVKLLILVLLCMVFARNTAMAFNRFIDRKIDENNPRTSKREIPNKIITPKNAFIFVAVNLLLFILTTYFINRICFYLSPIAIGTIIFYSFTKRFTFLSHFVLGACLGLAPIGAYLVVTGYFSIFPVLISILVTFWVCGFDIIYSLQDIEFDKKNYLFSIPAKVGIRKSLVISWICHLFVMFLILYIWDKYDMGLMYIIGGLLFSILLIYQHLIVKPYDLSKINIAFGTLNGIASLVFSTFVVIDIFI